MYADTSGSSATRNLQYIPTVVDVVEYLHEVVKCLCRTRTRADFTSRTCLLGPLPGSLLDVIFVTSAPDSLSKSKTS